MEITINWEFYHEVLLKHLGLTTFTGIYFLIFVWFSQGLGLYAIMRTNQNTRKIMQITFQTRLWFQT